MRIIVSAEEVRKMSLPESVRFLSFANSHGATVELDTSGLCDYLEKTIIGIESGENGKEIHFYGFGYATDDNSRAPYRFVEYTGFIAPADEVFDRGIRDYEAEHQEQFKQYVTDCTAYCCKWYYEHYDNGDMPTPILTEELNPDTPDGMYILF